MACIRSLHWPVVEALGWLVMVVGEWLVGWEGGWLVGLIVLLGCAELETLSLGKGSVQPTNQPSNQ
jgi:hypothetical protein